MSALPAIGLIKCENTINILSDMQGLRKSASYIAFPEKNNYWSTFSSQTINDQEMMKILDSRSHGNNH